MTDQILHRAREMCAEDMKANDFHPHMIRRALEGWFDQGTYVTRFMAQAEAELLKARPEAQEE